MTASPDRAPTNRPWLPFALLLALGTLWGSTFSISKLAMEAGTPPLGYAFWQMAGAAAVLSLTCRLRGLRPRLTRRLALYCVIAGFLGIAIPTVNFYFVVKHVPAGLMAILITTAPMMTYLMALGLGMERLSALRLAGLALGLAGALCILLPRGSLPAPEMLPWTLLGFVTPLFYSINSIYAAAARPPNSPSLVLAAGIAAAAAALLFPAALGSGSFYWIGSQPLVSDLSVLAQICVSSMAYVIMLELLRTGGAVFFSQVGYIVTLTGILWGMIFFSERHSAWLLVAALLVLAGLALVNYKQKGAKPPEAP
ncbi:MAG: DMT family transporter [Rhodovibrionaceae bacterium]